MICTRVVMLVLGLAGVAGCSGGGGGSTVVGPAWPKFRHDLNNSGQGIGPVVKNPGGVPTPVRILWATNIDDTPISASPAISLGGYLIIGTEGGTVAAVNRLSGVPYWTTNSCPAPTSGAPCTRTTANLGPLVSSPAVYTSNTTTSAVFATTDGALYVFSYDFTNLPTCTFCFQPTPTVADPIERASFLSSPTFLTNPATGTAAGIFVGAQVTVNGKNEGRLYALNVDGTVRWQFPPSGASPIGTITSSPAIGVGNTLYFTTDAGWLYALTLAGDLKWQVQVTSPVQPQASRADPSAPEPTPIEVAIDPSPVANQSSVVTSFANGVIQALNADGSPFWHNPTPSSDPDFANSLAIGAPANTATPTPGPATLTPTPTGTIPPVVPLIAVVGVHKSGSIVLLNAATGDCLRKAVSGECLPLQPPTDVPATIVGPVVSSPALSSDGYIVFGDHAGVLHAVSTLDGTEPRAWLWPQLLVPTPGATPRPIRSSPTIDSEGSVYVGSDDGYLYSVGTQTQ